MSLLQQFAKCDLENLVKSKPIREIQTFNEYLEEAKMESDLKMLFGNFCHANELIIIAGKSGVGKSVLAYTIADGIARGVNILEQINENEPQTILYYDFELTAKHIKKRFGFADYIPPENFFRPNVSKMLLDSDGVFDFDMVENDVIQTNAKVVIVDNISALSLKITSDVQSALDLIKRSVLIKNKFNITLILIAHTPKIKEQRPLDLYDISGASSIHNFIDSAFMINKSCKDVNKRYIKSVKNRSSQELDKVLICTVSNENWLHFEYECFDDEINHIQIDEERQQKQLNNLKEICNNLFDEVIEYRHNNLCRKYADLYNKSTENGRKIIAKLQTANLIIKTPEGKYIKNENEF